MLYSPPGDDSVSDFVCRNNIFLFVRSLVTHFKLDQETVYFEPPALYQFQDVGQVREQVFVYASIIE